MKARASFAALAAMLSAAPALGQSPPGPPPGPDYVAPAPGQPVDPKPPGHPDQTPAFREQYRAPYAPSRVQLEVETVADGLEFPWGFDFLPDGRIIVTERPGRIRLIRGHELSPPIAGVPEVHVQAISGMLDVILDPRFAANHLVYWTYVEPRGGKSSAVAVARGRLTDGPEPRFEDVKVIYRQEPALVTTHSNYGGRMLFAKDGTLWVALGDRDEIPWRKYIHTFDNGVGKLVRIHTDGSPVRGPMARAPDERPEIWADGFRNPLGIAYRPGTSELWMTDVGPRGGDELNLVRPGRDYGWPLIGYGREYSGQQVGYGTAQEGLEQPVYYWDPVISPSGLAFYSGKLFPQWRGDAFVTSLSQQHLDRLVLRGDRVVGEERLLSDLHERLRAVKQGPDGALYVLTDNSRGRLLRLTPKR
jgi:glucose/arabinose dehydrogenase